MYAVFVLSHQVARDGWQNFVDLTPGKGYKLRALCQPFMSLKRFSVTNEDVPGVECDNSIGYFERYH